MSETEITERMTAYHEAGHAVAAVFVGLPFENVSIVADDDTFGHVELAKNFTRGANNDPVRFLGAFTLVMLAGDFAARLAGETQPVRGSDRDYQQAIVSIGGMLEGTPWVGDFNSFAELHMRVAIRWVKQNAADIEAVAEKLLDRRTLSAAEVAEVVGQTQQVYAVLRGRIQR